MEKDLKAITQGAGIIFISTIIVYFLSFIYRLIVARYLGPEEYGIFILAITVLGIGRVISQLGLHSGIIKYISHYLSLEKYNKVKGIIISSLLWTSISGIIIGLIIFLTSPILSQLLSHSNKLTIILKIFAIIIPLNALVEIIKSVFLSFKKVIFVSLTEIIGEKIFNLILISIAILLGQKVIGISMAYLLTYLLTTALGIVILETKVFKLTTKIKAELNNKQLLKFSLPILMIGMVNLILSWSDSILIGALKDSISVGIYNVGFSLAYSILIIPKSFESLFYPISSQLFAKNNIQEISDIFKVISRWIFMLLLPITIIVVIFSKDIIKLFFGQEYVSSWIVLSIITIGIMIGSMFGPIENLLLTFKKTKILIYITISLVTLNIILNTILIPISGIKGAAIATAFTWTLNPLINYFIAKRMITITYNISYYLKYVSSAILSTIPLIATIYFFPNRFNIIIGPSIFLIFYTLFAILFRSFTKEDLMILSAIENKTNIKLPLIKSILKKLL